MSVILQAPLPRLSTTTILPNPQFSDSQGRQHSISIHRAIDGTIRTYVKSNQRQKLSYTFNLTTMKAEELRRFVQAYYRAPLRLTNHKDERWHVYFTSNPFEFTTSGRHGPLNEFVEITLELEGERE